MFFTKIKRTNLKNYENWKYYSANNNTKYNLIASYLLAIQQTTEPFKINQLTR